MFLVGFDYSDRWIPSILSFNKLVLVTIAASSCQGMPHVVDQCDSSLDISAWTRGGWYQWQEETKDGQENEESHAVINETDAIV